MELRRVGRVFGEYYKRLWAKHTAGLKAGIDYDALSKEEWNEMVAVRSRYKELLDLATRDEVFAYTREVFPKV